MAEEKKTTTKTTTTKTSTKSTSTKTTATKTTATKAPATKKVASAKVEEVKEVVAPKKEEKVVAKPKKVAEKQLKVTLVKSTIGYNKKQALIVKALGLGKLNSSHVLPDNACVRGMIFKVSHLVKVEELN